jgi:aminoglycoside 3-N-acetyltransferase
VEQPAPYTTQSLAADLSALGMRAGEVVLVHSSMTRLGFVVGGVQAVVQAVLDVLGPDGTVVVPTHTPDNTDPAGWQHPPVPEAWWPAIRQQAPGFDPSRTPSRWMGVLAEAVRTWPGAVRSDHPQVSFAALGKHAAAITQGHRLDDALGEQSPLGGLPAARQGAAAGLRPRRQHLAAPGGMAPAVAAAGRHRLVGPPPRRDHQVDHLG